MILQNPVSGVCLNLPDDFFQDLSRLTSHERFKEYLRSHSDYFDTATHYRFEASIGGLLVSWSNIGKVITANNEDDPDPKEIVFIRFTQFGCFGINVDGSMVSFCSNVPDYQEVISLPISKFGQSFESGNLDISFFWPRNCLKFEGDQRLHLSRPLFDLIDFQPPGLFIFDDFDPEKIQTRKEAEEIVRKTVLYQAFV